MINISVRHPASDVEAEHLKDHVGKTVELHGIVYKIREMSGFAFVILKTKRALVQCVYLPKLSNLNLSGLRENMSVVITGEVTGDERSRTGIEVRLLSFEVLSAAVEETPVVINNKEVGASLDTLLDYRPITLRNAKERAIFQIQAGICRGLRRFLEDNGFVEIHSPKLVFSGAEGGANIFKLDYFGREAYLTQSPQFYKQIMVGVFERVYEIAPVFRAEKHDTSRHINEYTSVDLEMGFIESFYDIMRLETQMIIETLELLREYYSAEFALLKADIPIFTEIPAITFREAREMLAAAKICSISEFDDFDPEEEKLVCKIIKEQTGSDFVFVTHYKASKRPFYAMNTKTDPAVTESFDLLFRGMEITTGGQRIHDYFEQTAKMQALGMNTESFTSYLMAHKYGLPPHGGLGFGLERFTAKLLGFENVRLATMFPRDINRLIP